MKEGIDGARLLPWAGPEGKRCYLVTDGTGCVSRLADGIESVQLGMAAELLGHAADMLADRRATPAQLRYLLARMSEALTDVCRIAESRGDRLPVTGEGDPGATDGLGRPAPRA
ncbi:hypothetical protein ACWD5Q_19390 [Streptomyces sp. NPDC002513]